MSEGLTVYLSNGTYVKFPEGFDAEQDFVDWFRDARPGQVIKLNAANVITYVQKRHITHVTVGR